MSYPDGIYGLLQQTRDLINTGNADTTVYSNDVLGLLQNIRDLLNTGDADTSIYPPNELGLLQNIRDLLNTGDADLSHYPEGSYGCILAIRDLANSASADISVYPEGFFGAWNAIKDFADEHGLGLPDFALEAETSTYTDAFVNPVSTQRQTTINTLIKTLKDGGVWSKITNGGKGAAWLVGGNEDEWLIDITGNGFDLTKVSTPTFAANDGVTCSNTAYYDTGWNPSTLGITVNDFHVSCFSKSSALSNSAELGIFSNPNGISIYTGTTANGINVRLNGAVWNSTVAASDASGHILGTLTGTTAKIYRNGELYETNSSYSAAAAVNLPIHIGRLNGATSSAGHKLGFVSVGAAITSDAQAQIFHGAVRTALNAIQYGDLHTFEPAYSPASVSADVVVYGATGSGCLAAYEAIRQGKTAVIVGGWRERRIGGMSAGGLGFTDMDNHAAIGGLPRYLITKVNSIYGRADTTFSFEPRVFSWALRGLLDPARTGGLDVPIYWSTGVASVTKNGVDITSFRTRDGRTFSGSQFIDASYEGDLLAAAGCSYAVGREAAGSSVEASNGWRGKLTTQRSNNMQFALPQESGTFYNIDPYVIEGNAGSGLLSGVQADPGLSNGAADSRVQAYNFRLTLSDSKFRRSAPFSTKPAGWDIATYEPLLRYLAALTADSKVFGTDYTFANVSLWTRSTILTSPYNIFDINSGGGQSTDYWGQSIDYPEADYDTRETIWQAHQDYIRGLLYLFCYGRTNEGETRIPASLETAARAYGYDREHYNDPYPGDPYWFPPQLYAREGRRLVASYIHDGNDIAATDGTTPRSTKTVAVASYTMDSHHVMAMADLSGTPRIWNTGGFQDATAGGVDNLSPVPYEVMTPDAAECTNLLVTFAISATHVAFGSVRMEFTSMAMGQAAGMAACLAIDGDVNIQDIDYSTLRTALLDSPTLSGEVDPVLVQTN